MSAPKLTFPMIRSIDFQGDPHLAIKQLNQVIEEKFLSDQGKCPHRPSNLVVSMSGDMSYKAKGSFCVFCSSEIEIDRIVWKAKSPLPERPAI